MNLGSAVVGSAVLHAVFLANLQYPAVILPAWQSKGPMQVSYIPTQRPPAPKVVARAPKRGLKLPTKAVKAAAAPKATQRITPAPQKKLSPVRKLASIIKPRRQTRKVQPKTQKAGSSMRGGSGGVAPALLTPEDFAEYEYQQQVRQTLKAAMVYPEGVGVTAGKAWLTVTIDRSGHLKSVWCTKAEAEIYRLAALEGARSIQRFASFPRELKNQTLTFEFVIAFRPSHTAVSS